MKITISRKLLDKELTKVSRPVTSNNSLPSLSGILFDVDTDKLTLIGSNGNTAIKAVINKTVELLDIEQVGKIILPVKYIVEIVKKIDSEKIVIELIRDNIIHIYNDKSEFNIVGISSDEYPRFDFSINEKKTKLTTTLIDDINRQVAFATSLSDNRPILKGVNISSKNNLVITATDSHRLARKVVENSFNSFNLTVPKLIISDLTKIVEKSETVDLYIKERSLIFKFDNITIFTKLIEGSYPDTEKLIPDNFSRSLIVNKDELIKAVERVSLISSDSKSIIKFDLRNNEFYVLSAASDYGKGEEKIEDFEFTGDNINISLNAHYLLSALKTFDSNKIVVKITSDIKPLIITEINDNSLIQLVLPIRTY